MSNEVFFYASLVLGAVPFAGAWLAVNDLIHGKKLRFDSLPNRQKPALTRKTALIQFDYGALPVILVLWAGIYYYSW